MKICAVILFACFRYVDYPEEAKDKDKKDGDAVVAEDSQIPQSKKQTKKIQ
jgi:hypothetical protein